MKQYDKIIVPYDGEVTLVNGVIIPHHKEVKNKIVCTVEELRALWRLAMEHGVRPYDTMSFEDYLESKHISL